MIEKKEETSWELNQLNNTAKFIEKITELEIELKETIAATCSPKSSWAPNERIPNLTS